jgi:translation initiation factor 2B subunit (eIF-2B alpha/beta/delta family)
MRQPWYFGGSKPPWSRDLQPSPVDPDHPVDALLEALRGDVRSGAAQVSRAAAEVIVAAARDVHANTADELRARLTDVVMRVLDAQPAMAPLVALARDVLESLARADSIEGVRESAAGAAHAFGAELEARSRRIADRVAALLPAGSVVATLSRSSTVAAALLGRERPAAGRVVCLESRPMREGRLLAAALAERGVPVTYAVDAAAASLVPECDVVLLGADSIGDHGVVNKIGSTSVAEAAARASVPVYVVADTAKFLPHGFPQPLADDRPGGEVWDAPAGIRVWNRYFEILPLDLVSAVVTESGALTPAQVVSVRSAIVLPNALSAWAERAAAGPTRGGSRGNAPAAPG